VVRKLELDQTVYKNLVSILIQRLLDVSGLKFIIQWFFFFFFFFFFFVSFVLCACSSFKAQGICFFSFQSLHSKQNSRMSSKVDKFFSKLVLSLCLFVGVFRGLVVLFC
jgi:hypothetical protein